jgi:hypothetical protein
MVRMERNLIMSIYIWRHSKQYSSWSMFDEPHVYRDNTLQAEVLVPAVSEQEALEIIREEKRWDVDELQRIKPSVITLDEPAVVAQWVLY